MTATPILESLAREFNTSTEHIRNALEMLDAGLSAPFIGRFRRMQAGTLSESVIRRLERRRAELEELDRRRGTILRVLERDFAESDAALEPIRQCMDRFELEDLFVPHRRPEPEVQLALDRGLGALADLLVEEAGKGEPLASEKGDRNKRERGDARAGGAADGEAGGEDDGGDSGGDDGGDSGSDAASVAAAADAAPAETPDRVDAGAPEASAAPDASKTAESSTPPTSGATDATSADGADGAGGSEVAGPADPAHGSASVTAPEVSTENGRSTPALTDASASSPAENTAASPAESPAESGSPRPNAPAVSASGAARAPSDDGGGLSGAAITPLLARLCAPFVSPDRGIHTEVEALSGAMRILSDRLGRDPRLRGAVRALLRKQGVLSVRPAVDEGKAGRHRPLLKVRQPLRQLQGHRLLAIRQAQKERVLNTVIDLDRKKVLSKVRSGLGRPTTSELCGVLDEVASRALERRLLPIIEADVRLELKERGDSEALRFLSQHLRQILLTPPLGRHPVVGVDVSAKGDWTFVPLDAAGEVAGEPAKIERKTAEGEVKDAATLGAEIAPHVPAEAWCVAVGHGKGSRAAVSDLRAALAAASRETFVCVVNEAGLSSYANSQLARTELAELGVPARMAVSLGRRLQDPLAEILKVDPRHLGLGSEQGLVSKANLKRVFQETIESCVAHVGCVLDQAPLSVLQHVPGLDRPTAERLIARRAEKPFTSREELRHDGVVTEAQWASAVAFLRIPGSPEPLDATSLHPEQYDLARRVLESAGSSVEDGLGRMGVTKGLRRADFDLDEGTWRDLMREIAYPGRDPRPRLARPTLLEPDTDPVRLTKDRVLIGIVTNVASFGAFVDIGLPQDAMIHISEISDHYVRDVREFLSIGQSVRAKILDGSGQRVSLSLKKVPFERPRGAGRGGENRGESRGRGPRRGPGRGAREERESANVRAALTRRDGMGAPSGRGRRGPGGGPGGPGGPGGGPGGGRGGGRRGPGQDRRGRDEGEAVDLRKVNQTSGGGFSPFASFFKEREHGEEGESSSSDS